MGMLCGRKLGGVSLDLVDTDEAELPDGAQADSIRAVATGRLPKTGTSAQADTARPDRRATITAVEDLPQRRPSAKENGISGGCEQQLPSKARF
jgi:hypothetical protein